MSPRQRPAGPRGARFQAVSAESSYVEIGWDLCGMLPQQIALKRTAAAIELTVSAIG